MKGQHASLESVPIEVLEHLGKEASKKAGDTLAGDPPRT